MRACRPSIFKSLEDTHSILQISSSREVGRASSLSCGCALEPHDIYQNLLKLLKFTLELHHMIFGEETENVKLSHMLQRLYTKSLGKIVRAVLKWLDFYNRSAFLLKFTKVLLKSKVFYKKKWSHRSETVVTWRK